jgi:hypothetical protein
MDCEIQTFYQILDVEDSRFSVDVKNIVELHHYMVAWGQQSNLFSTSYITYIYFLHVFLLCTIIVTD